MASDKRSTEPTGPNTRANPGKLITCRHDGARKTTVIGTGLTAPDVEVKLVI